MQYLINGRQMVVDSYGAGAALLLVHGLGGTANSWFPVVAAFAGSRRVIVPEPNFCVVPVVVFRAPPRSSVIEPEPKGRVRVCVPSDQRVIVPEPNFCVFPVTVLPSGRRSVVIEPEPKGRVWALEPSVRRVSDPEP